jgi:hypothetical protein
MSSDSYADDGGCWRSVKSDDGYDTADDTADDSDGFEASRACRRPSTWENTSSETYSKGYHVWYCDPQIEGWALCGFALGVSAAVELVCYGIRFTTVMFL